MITPRGVITNMKSIHLSKYIKTVFESQQKELSEWFGYYNYDTLNFDHTRMLANRIAIDGVAPVKGTTIQIGYYDLKSGQWHHIDDTDSWNWQQGAMAQWLPNNGNGDAVIYNCSDGQKLYAKIYNVETESIKTIDWSIYGVTPSGGKSISIDLERSYWCRAYHYQSICNKIKDGLVYEGDGIFEIDLNNNTRKRLISIRDIINTDKKSDFDKQKHWVEHVMISPNGKRICFLHRFSKPDNVMSYSTRLFIANIDGTNLTLLPGWENTIYTHFGWKSDNEFAIYTYTPYRFQVGRGFRELIKERDFFSKDFLHRTIVELASRLPYGWRTKIVGRRTYYQFYKVGEDNKVMPSNSAESQLFCVDGHPSFTSDGRYMITDSYPWKDGFQRLIVYDTQTRKGLVIAKFYAYYCGNPASCDLHPKLSRNNKYLVVDTAYNAYHHMIMFEIDWEQIKKNIS